MSFMLYALLRHKDLNKVFTPTTKSSKISAGWHPHNWMLAKPTPYNWVAQHPIWSELLNPDQYRDIQKTAFWYFYENKSNLAELQQLLEEYLPCLGETK